MGSDCCLWLKEVRLLERDVVNKLQGKLKFVVGAVMVVAGWVMLAEMLAF